MDRGDLFGGIGNWYGVIHSGVVKRFWILDLRFWICSVHKGRGFKSKNNPKSKIQNPKSKIVPLTRGGVLNRKIIQNPKSKIQNCSAHKGRGFKPKNNPKSKIQNPKLARSNSSQGLPLTNPA
jgi:hypothetical protein